jgi:multisubunit Na+/H+ antiporter MnhB subunit
VGVEHRRPATKLLHGAVALAVGLSLGAITLAAAGVPAPDPAGAREFAAALPEGHGRNAVNVILVDFRGADTLGEIAVLAISALGALLVLSGTTGHPPPRPPDSPILRKVARGLLPGALVFALYLLVRGHDAPGGGFIAGLVISLAFALEGIAMGAAIGRRRFRGRSSGALALGLALAIAGASLALVRGEPFFTHFRGGPSLTDGPVFATTLLFEAGVLLVVVATTSVFASVFRSRGKG